MAKGCYARLEDNNIILSTGLMEMRCCCHDTRLHIISVTNLETTQKWNLSCDSAADPVDLSTAAEDNHLVATVSCGEQIHRFQLYPGLLAIMIENGYPDKSLNLSLEPRHRRGSCVRLSRAACYNLVEEQRFIPFRDRVDLSADLLILVDLINHSGLLILSDQRSVFSVSEEEVTVTGRDIRNMVIGVGDCEEGLLQSLRDSQLRTRNIQQIELSWSYCYQALNSIWRFSRFAPPQILRTRFHSPSEDQDDVLAVVSPEYRFATSIMCQGELPEDMSETMQICARHRELIHKQMIFPVGEEPDGTSWTGFQTINKASGGYFLLCREYNQENQSRIKMWNVANHSLTFTHLAGEGEDFSASVDKGNYMPVELPHPHSFALYSYEVVW